MLTQPTRRQEPLRLHGGGDPENEEAFINNRKLPTRGEIMKKLKENYKAPEQHMKSVNQRKLKRMGTMAGAIDQPTAGGQGEDVHSLPQQQHLHRQDQRLPLHLCQWVRRDQL